MTARQEATAERYVETTVMIAKTMVRALCVGVISLTVAGASQAQEVPACQNEDVFKAAAEAVTEAHAKSNFAGLGTANKVISALGFMIDYEPAFEVRPTVENLANLAQYGPENIRPCMTSEWAFNERALVFIMLNPDDPSDWGLFMYNVALDLPVATGWVGAPPVE
jgi:hypothetical protein